MKRKYMGFIEIRDCLELQRGQVGNDNKKKKKLINMGVGSSYKK